MKPVITEKSIQATAQNCYTFQVDKRAKKSQIKKAVEEKFKVNVVRIRTMNVGKKKKGKKAIVELKDGQKIEGFGGEK